MKNIFVGNLPFRASEEEVRDLFTQYGTVHSVNLITDRETGRPRGFGFVEMDQDAADAAIRALDGTEFGGRNLQVNEARDKRGGGGPRREGSFERRGGGDYDRGGRNGGGYDRGDRSSRYSR